MPLPDERQAKALERIAISASHMLKVMETLNENLVAAFGFLKEQIEKDNERIAGYETAADPNQMTIDEMRAASEKAEKEREDRSGYLTCGCTMLHCDTHLAELDRAKRAEREARPIDPIHPDAKYTPAEWMDVLKRWWNYEDVDFLATVKMTRARFSAYMEHCRATEITHQVPDKYKGVE